MNHPDLYEDVRKFHLKFGLPTVDDGNRPGFPDRATAVFRLAFLAEELTEMREAIEEKDLAGVADAIVDLVYVALGTAHFFHLPFDELWREVHRANMQKERAESASDSKRGTTLDVVKPEGWVGPQIQDVLDRAIENPRRGYRVPRVGQWVKSLVDFAGVPKGSTGVVDEDYGTGIMVAWNLPGRPIPRDYFDPETGRPNPARRRAGDPNAPTRDGFDKATEMKFLEVVAW